MRQTSSTVTLFPAASKKKKSEEDEELCNESLISSDKVMKKETTGSIDKRSVIELEFNKATPPEEMPEAQEEGLITVSSISNGLHLCDFLSSNRIVLQLNTKPRSHHLKIATS